MTITHTTKVESTANCFSGTAVIDGDVVMIVPVKMEFQKYGKKYIRPTKYFPLYSWLDDHLKSNKDSTLSYDSALTRLWEARFYFFSQFRSLKINKTILTTLEQFDENTEKRLMRDPEFNNIIKRIRSYPHYEHMSSSGIMPSTIIRAPGLAHIAPFTIEWQVWIVPLSIILPDSRDRIIPMSGKYFVSSTFTDVAVDKNPVNDVVMK